LDGNYAIPGVLWESFLDEKFNMESIAPLLVVQDPGTGA
jgi:hypothetical protein